MKVSMMNILWLCTMLTYMFASKHLKTKANDTMSERHHIPHEQAAIEKRSSLPEQYEPLKHLPKTVNYIAAFKDKPGAHRVEAALGLKWLLEHSQSLQEVKELLGKPDEFRTEHVWRYHLREKQWIEIAFNTQRQVVELAFLLDVMHQDHVITERVHPQEARLYTGVSTKEILRFWEQPHWKQKERNTDGVWWFYQFDEEGIWKLFITQSVLKDICYVTIPVKFSSSEKRSVHITRDAKLLIPDLKMAIVEFKTTGDRRKAAKVLIPLIQRGSTSRHDLEELLGFPDSVSNDGRVYVYALWFSEYISISFNEYGLVEKIFSVPDSYGSTTAR